MSRKGITLMPNALICEDSKLRGVITIGSGTIVHPTAAILAEAGPIIIGENCLIEEQAVIHHRLPFDEPAKDEPPTLVIGSNNVFEVDCRVEAPSIGDSNVFEAKSFVGNKVIVTNGCTIGAGCKVTEPQTLKENIVIFGEKCQMREAMDRPAPQTLQMETLAKMLPNYHLYRRAAKK